MASGAMSSNGPFGPDGSSWRSPLMRTKQTAWRPGHQYAKEPSAKLVDDMLREMPPMQKPPLDPDVADTAPTDTALTVYDEEHVITYLRLLDADAKGADWREVTRVVLHLDPERESDRAGERSTAIFREPNG
jgi:hypothetical protein